MLKIRLQRVGRKHEPAFRLVLTDSKNSTKSGRFKEILGSYDPRKSTDSIKEDRVRHWLSQGAQPSDTAHNLLVTHKIIDAKKRNVLPKKTLQKSAEVDITGQASTPPVQEEPKVESNTTEEASTSENQPIVEETPSEEVPTEEVEKEVVQ